MPVLYLLRHAKSGWDSPALDDFDRPLSRRGRAAAPLMGAHMRGTGVRPDIVLCSAALRARETLELVAPHLGKPAVSIERELYLAAAGVLLQRLRKVQVGKVMLIGHNPGLERLALDLAGDGDPDDLAQLREKFPTAALAELHFAFARWTELAPGSGRLMRFVVPRAIGGTAYPSSR